MQRSDAVDGLRREGPRSDVLPLQVREMWAHGDQGGGPPRCSMRFVSSAGSMGAISLRTCVGLITQAMLRQGYDVALASDEHAELCLRLACGTTRRARHWRGPTRRPCAAWPGRLRP